MEWGSEHRPTRPLPARDTSRAQQSARKGPLGPGLSRTVLFDSQCVGDAVSEVMPQRHPGGLKRKFSSMRENAADTHLSPQIIKMRKVERLDPGLNLPAPTPFNPLKGSDDPGGELFVCNGLPQDISRTKLIDSLAEVFHHPDFLGDRPPFNFDIQLSGDPDRPRKAWITMPEEILASHFLSDGYSVILPYERKPLHIVRSLRTPDPHLVRQIRMTPFVSAAELEKQEELVRELGERLPLSVLSFGIWDDDEGIFSVEYFVKARDPHPHLDEPSRASSSLWYDSDRHAVILQHLGVTIHSRFSRRKITLKPKIVISVKDISAVYTDISESFALFHMYRPVIFENDRPEDSPYGSGNHDRVRCPSFDEEHFRIAKFTSSEVLVKFASPATLRSFIVKVRNVAQFPLPSDRRIKAARYGRYERTWTDTLQNWYERLPLSVALQCEQAIHSGVITPDELAKVLRPDIDAELKNSGEQIAAHAIQVLIQRERERQTVKAGPRSRSWSTAYRDATAHALLELRSKKRWTSHDFATCYILCLTPTTFLVEGPFQDRSNHILRLYPKHQHYFMRVCFTEEGGVGRKLSKPRRSPVDWSHFVQTHVGGVLRNGFSLAGRHYEWLGYSQSALKEFQVIFMTPFEHEGRKIDSAYIRQELGDFEKVYHQPAKYGARLAQAFSATSATIEIAKDCIEKINDIERNSYCFTDGAGEISEDMASMIWKGLRMTKGAKSRSIRPCAFQARFGGCKGVWVINRQLQGDVIRIRPSQIKFESKSTAFEVANTSVRPIKTNLNRPLIKLLEDLGVSKQTFVELQEKAIQDVERAQTTYIAAAELMQLNNLGNHFRASRLYTNLYNMLEMDFHCSPKGHIDFLQSCAMLAVVDSLRDLKYKARIPVMGPTLIGVCDTWGILKEGEVYVKVVDGREKLPALFGKVIVTRSPVIHPGDVQFVIAIGEVPENSPLSVLYNVVVFSSQGSRPLPSMLGGGDLDGDQFNIITDERLYPAKMSAPGDYEAVKPRKTELPCTMDDVADFVVDFILGDLTGIISTLHLKVSDQSPLGSFDQKCFKLAELASHAVDFAKSGEPVNPKLLPKPDSKFKPDFLANQTDDIERDTYPSRNALGLLYRAVPLQRYARPLERQKSSVDGSVLIRILRQVRICFPQLCLRPPECASEAWEEVFKSFCGQVERIAFRNCLSNKDHLKLSEEELFLGTSGIANKIERSEYDLLFRARTEISENVQRLRREIKYANSDDALDSDEDDEQDGAGDDEEASDLGRADSPAGNSVWGQASGDELLPLATDTMSSINVVKRAYSAAYYALDVLMDNEYAPYGTRLYAFVCIDLLLSTIRSKGWWQDSSGELERGPHSP